MEIVCSELKFEDRLAVANVNEGDRLAFVTYFHGLQTMLSCKYKGQCLVI